MKEFDSDLAPVRVGKTLGANNKEAYMLKRSAVALMVGGMLAAAPTVYSGESDSMSDAQHRKTMGGMHHPEHVEDANKQDGDKKSPTMSDAQHRKTMSGLHHTEHVEDASKQDGDKKSPTMSDAQHRKTMGGSHHPDKD